MDSSSTCTWAQMPARQLVMLRGFAEVTGINFAWLCFFFRLADVRGRIWVEKGRQLLVVGVTATEGLVVGSKPRPMQNLALLASKRLLANSGLWPVNNLISLASTVQYVPIVITNSLYWIGLKGSSEMPLS